MNIVMFTNTYDPMIGGAESSIKAFAEDLRELGHGVLIVTPAFEGAEESTDQIIRLPSIKKIAATRYSLCLPFSGELEKRLKAFAPDMLHCHQPFHLGDTALRYARQHGLPLVFTHHTLYERYIGSHESNADPMRRLAMALPTEFANLCDAVVAPTASIAELIAERGVTQPIHIVPTGVDVDHFACGDRAEARQRWNLPDKGFVLGHVGRLIPAKNLDYLAAAVAGWLKDRDDEARFLLVGDGDSAGNMQRQFEQAGVAERVIATGKLTGDDLVGAYAAMDLFAFSSLTDTQGMVLIEALSAATPIVALDATGSRDVIAQDQTGLLLPTHATPDAFAEAIASLADDPDRLASMREAATEAARGYDRIACAKQLVEVYESARSGARSNDLEPWDRFAERVGGEWDLLMGKVQAAASSLWPR